MLQRKYNEYLTGYFTTTAVTHSSGEHEMNSAKASTGSGCFFRVQKELRLFLGGLAC